MNNEIDELAPAEREALRKLSVEMDPPSRLERKIVQTLREHDLIRDNHHFFWAWVPRFAGAAGVAAVLLVCGIILGTWWSGQPNGTEQEAKFMLVLRSGHGDLSGDEASRVREYGAWAQNLGQRGLLVDAEKLHERAYLVRSVNGTFDASELDTTTPESIRGYFVIKAKDTRHALSVAEESPHVRYGGSIEVRQIDKRSN